MKRITILGAGAWGTALATVLAQNGYEVILWCHEKNTADQITNNHTNSLFLPDIILDRSITATSSLEQACTGANWIFEAVPVKFLRSVFLAAAPFITQDQKFVLLSKGLENDTLFLPSQILGDVFGSVHDYAVLAGPSFAMDLACKQLTGVVIASKHPQMIDELKQLLENEYFSVTSSQDVVGVQLCSALKNVITFVVGILDGAGYTDNTKVLFFVKAVEQMKILVVASNGQASTVDGLAGIGDAILTAFGKRSRNLSVGQRMGSGESIDSIQKTLDTVPESFNSISAIHQSIIAKKLSLPLFEALDELMQGSRSIASFVSLIKD
jgi:glycerol-3-phosphate dehydrogenase (NAD(P)+)